MERSHGLITKRVELEGCLFPAGGEEMAFEKNNMPAIMCLSLMLRMPLQAMVVASMLMIPECALILCNHEGWQKFSAINHCRTVELQ